MAVTSLSIWDIAPGDTEAAIAQAAEAKKLALALGANDMKVGQVQTGQFTGKWMTALNYDDMATLGRAMDEMANNAEYQAMLANIKGTLVSRTIIRGVDIG